MSRQTFASFQFKEVDMGNEQSCILVLYACGKGWRGAGRLLMPTKAWEVLRVMLINAESVEQEALNALGGAIGNIIVY